MAARIHRAFIVIDPRQRAHLLAVKLHARLQTVGARQLRFYRNEFRSYPFPAPRGYGTRGILVGTYTAAVSLEWIEEDLLQFLLGAGS